MYLGGRLSFLVFVSLATAGAATVYTQPPLWTQGNSIGNVQTSQVDSTTTGFEAFENFTLGANATIRSVSWYGVYLTGTLTNGAPNTTSWDLSFSADSSGAPGTQLSLTTLTAAQVTSNLVGTGNLGFNTINVYLFTANLSAFSATSGVQYWFSALSHGSTFLPRFAWMQGSGGDNVSYSLQLTSGTPVGSSTPAGDRAFTLYDTAQVPEPSSILLVLPFGLAFLFRKPRGQAKI